MWKRLATSSVLLARIQATQLSELALLGGLARAMAKYR